MNGLARNGGRPTRANKPMFSVERLKGGDARRNVKVVQKHMKGAETRKPIKLVCTRIGWLKGRVMIVWRIRR
jgi:hypothetical protein